MLYTGKGDDGTTTVFGARDRISKDAPVIEALGALDELNSWLGVCRVEAGERGTVIAGIQHTLFIIQAELAGAPKTVSTEAVTALSGLINTIETALPPITTFFLPGGTPLAARLDYARTLARRAERRVIAARETRSVGAETIAYLNRLSSLLYALARRENVESGITEEPPHY